METIGNTKRLLLRETKPNDGQVFFELNNDPEVIKFTGDPAFSSVEEASQFLHDYDHFEKHGRGRWAIVDILTHEVLGWCGLKFHPDNGENDLGYRLFKKHWNKGYATEASHLSLQYGFRRLGLESVIARADKENKASIRVMNKLGFKYEKDFEDHGSICEQHRIDKYSYTLQSSIDLEINVY